jgi:hypothetical protein
MYKNLLCAITLLTSFTGNLFAQEKGSDQMQIGFHYKIKNQYGPHYPLTIYYLKNGLPISKRIHGNMPLKANLSPDTNGKVKIEFWGFKAQPQNLMGNDLFVNMQDSTHLFYFEIADNPTLGYILKYRSIPYAVTEVGAMTIPFKYYFKDGSNDLPADASTDLNLSLYVGRKWGRQRFYRDKEKNHESVSFTATGFFGPTKIEIKKESVKDTSSFTVESNELGIALGAGVGFSYRDFNIGIFGGIDVPLSEAGRNWNYAYKPWIGFGIGYALKIFSGN